jgi:PadR family transcriptional regulator PadR
MGKKWSLEASMELTTLDQRLMLAAIGLHPNAYGVAIQDYIHERTGQKPPSIGSVYASIDRLEKRGFIRTRLGEPTKERGGRAKLYVTVTAKGQASLRQSLQALAALQQGVPIGNFPAPVEVPT